MTVAVANVANTNTFDFWRNRTNELANAMSTVAVTVNSNTATGNAAISGRFIANTISVGNSTVNTVFSTANSTQQSNGQYYLNANGNWALIRSPFISNEVTTTGTGSQVLDSFLLTDYISAEYFISVKSNSTNAYHSTKILTMHNTNFAYITEFGSIISNTSVASFTVSTNSTHLIVNATPTVANTTIKFVRVNL